MKKQSATRWYIGAWSVGALALCALALMDRGLSPDTSPPGASVAYISVAVASVVMVAAWLAALLDAAHRGAWRWFAVLLVTQLAFVGVVGMLAYAVLDRPHAPVEVAVRPAIT